MTKDQRIDGLFSKKLLKPRDDINHLIGVPYVHWNYASTAAGKAEELAAKEKGTFECKVADFVLMHQFPASGTKASFKADAFKLQLKIADDEEPEEPFWLQHPFPYLTFRNSPESKLIDPALHAEPEPEVTTPMTATPMTTTPMTTRREIGGLFLSCCARGAQ